jgi:uncharacterized Zn-finger protein
MKKVKWYIHHQLSCDCPYCGSVYLEYLGETAFAEEGEEKKCSICDKTFKLGEKAE